MSLLLDVIDELVDPVGGRVRRGHLDARGVVEQLAREPANVVRERGGEEEALALRRQQRDHAPDVGQEAHVEHPIGLVEHEDLDAAEIDVALRRVIEEPPGRRNQHVDAAAQQRGLRVYVHTAEYHRGAQRHVLAVASHAVLDLRRELPRRREDQRADAPPAVARRGGGQALKEGQREARRLAGARLGAR